MKDFYPIKEIAKANYKAGDVLVIFGELFRRGYVNGLIEEAEKIGMKIITGTVGRRNPENQLRPLNSEELSEKKYQVINVPIEAGFDLETPKNGKSPVEQLQGYKLSQWKEIQLDWNQIEQSRLQGEQRFIKSTKEFLKQVKQEIPKGARVLFAHTMAGGFPRARVVMPAVNKVVKGFEHRYASSQELWESEVGKLFDMSFYEVTAKTLEHLINESAFIREELIAEGGEAHYIAYGYHGTEILIKDKYQWQSYSPYLQGWAKLELENIAKKYFAQDIKVSVFNSPEILTNSSSIFLGIEIPLYKLLDAFVKEQPQSQFTQQLTHQCKTLLRDDVKIEELMKKIDDFFTSDLIKNNFTCYDQWPQHNGKEQMNFMLTQSKEIIKLHKDPKGLMTAQLSEIIFSGCGRVILEESWNPRQPVNWIGHDIIAKLTNSKS